MVAAEEDRRHYGRHEQHAGVADGHAAKVKRTSAGCIRYR